MITEYKYKQGDIRNWRILDKIILVKIVGVASTGVPILGITYCIDLLGYKFEGYDYTHAIAFERDLD